MPAHMHQGRGYVERNPDGFLTHDQLDEFRESIRDDDLSGVVMRGICAAPAILRNAAQAIDDRAALRDCPAGERSMARCVAAFNALTGHTLSETEGWHFMSILKLARATAGGHHLDDHTDHAAYAALAGESAEREACAA
jgi:hypothetical protein